METQDKDIPEIEIIDSGQALTAINKAEIDIQIATAKRWPRSLKTFKAHARTLATLDEDTAGSMFYVVPREGKTIEGPSIRFAEVVGSAWTNLRYGARIVGIDEKHVTAQGAAFDLESNVACTVEVKRRITNKYGKRYGDDMITTTSQAAMSIALRNAIFRVVPFALVKDIYEEARAASIGKGKTMAQRRQAAIDVFAKWGVGADKMYLIAGKASLDDLDDDALIKLRGIVTAIREGDTTIDDVLREVAAQPTTVMPDTLTPGSVATGQAQGTDTDEAPVRTEGATETAAPAAREKPNESAAPAIPLGQTVATRLAEIRDEAARLKVKQTVVDYLFKKHVGTTDMTTMPHDEETFGKLGRVLGELRGTPTARR